MEKSMTTTSSSASSAPRPVVGAAPKMPKVKYSSKVMAHINAFSIAFAIFLGLAAIFAAIAGFTKNAKMPWSFGVPFIGTFLGNNLYGGSALFVDAVFVLVFGVLSLMTLRKVTSIDDMKSAWRKIVVIFGVITAIFAVELVATAIYSLLGAGEKSGVAQGQLWLSSFLPIFILGLISAGVMYLAIQIANGKTQVLRVASYVAIAVAAIAFVLVLISTLVGFYSKKSYSNFYDDDYSSAVEELRDLFK